MKADSFRTAPVRTRCGPGLLFCASWLAVGGLLSVGSAHAAGAGDDRAAEASAAQALARVDASEELLLRLGSRLKAIETAIGNLDVPGGGAELFAGTVRVLDLGPRPSTFARPVAGKLGIDGWPLEAQAREVPRESLRLWRPFLDTVDFFTHAKFKLARGSLVDAGNRYESEIRFEGTARGNSGELIAARASIDALWLNRDSDWRIHEWRLRDFEIARTAEPWFAESLERALPDPLQLERARRSIHERLVTEMLRDPSVKPPHKYFDFQSLNRHPGLAVADVDLDGFDDLYVMERWGKNLLLRNRGDGTFVEDAARFGLDIAAHSSSAIFADFDNDGDLDAFIGRTLKRSLYLVNDDGKFVDRSEQLVATPLPFLVSSVSAADVNADGLLDVYFSTYGIDADLQEDFLPPAAVAEIGRRNRDGGHPFRNRPGPPNLLLLNVGEGRFAESPFAETAAGWRNTFQSSWSDFDGDGDVDVYLANDFAPNLLYANDGEGRFEDVTEQTGTADIGFGMGASWGDYDNDGRHDLYVSNMYSSAGTRITDQLGALGAELAPMARGNSLLRNIPERFARVSGLSPPALEVERADWAWGGQFVDVDNDGFLDVYAPNGYYTAPARSGVPPDL